jgi:hypothetical protein
MPGAAEITHHPERLSALCELWQDEQRDVWITLQGTSMLPTFPPGTRLRLDCAPFAPQVGEVIAFLRGGGLIVHRLIAIEPAEGGAETVYICRGDADAHVDPPVHSRAVVGVVRETRAPSAWERLRLGIQALRRHPLLAPIARVVRRRSGFNSL